MSVFIVQQVHQQKGKITVHKNTRQPLANELIKLNQI